MTDRPSVAILSKRTMDGTLWPVTGEAIHRSPVGDIYTVVDKFAPAATLTIEALPGVAIPAEPLFTDLTGIVHG